MIHNSSPAGTQPVTKVVLHTPSVDERRRRVARIKRGIRRQTSGAVHDLQVEVSGETLVLRGRCVNFYCKQKAQHAAMKYLSGEALINEIEVDAVPR
jgi:osmotically-inducible protein OsmY